MHPASCHIRQVSNSFLCEECGYYHIGVRNSSDQMYQPRANCPCPEGQWYGLNWSRRREFDRDRNRTRVTTHVKTREEWEDMARGVTRSSDIEGRKRVLQEQIDRAAEELALLGKFDGLNFPVGTVLRWTASGIDLDGTVYPYSMAVKKNDAVENGWLLVASNGLNSNVSLAAVINTILHDQPAMVEIAIKWSPLDETSVAKLNKKQATTE